MFLPYDVLSFTPLARLSLWPYHSNMSDELGDQIKEFAESENKMRHPKPILTIALSNKRSFDAAKINKKDDRIGFSINGPWFRKYVATKKIGKPALGECTLLNNKDSKGKKMHKYKGEVVKTLLTKTKSIYSRKNDFSEKYEYTQIMGGVSVSIFGLASAMVEATATTTIKRNRKSLLLYRHQRIHRGVSSLANVQVGENWETCTNIGNHYYLRDILTGMENYIFVNLYFSSESKRKELEVKIKIQILFFSISKTIRKVKTNLDKNVKIKVSSVSTFPKASNINKEFLSVDQALTYIEKLESQMDVNRQTIQKKAIKDLLEDKNAHLEYFFMPCMIQTVSAAMPFKPKKNTILFELIERVTEMKSVLVDVNALLQRGTSSKNKKTKLLELKNDIDRRLVGLNEQKKINEFSQGNAAQKLSNFYGPRRAPYYYERKLKNIAANMN